MELKRSKVRTTERTTESLKDRLGGGSVFHLFCLLMANEPRVLANAGLLQSQSNRLLIMG